MSTKKQVQEWIDDNNVVSLVISDDDVMFDTSDISGVLGNVFAVECLNADGIEFTVDMSEAEYYAAEYECKLVSPVKTSC